MVCGCIRECRQFRGQNVGWIRAWRRSCCFFLRFPILHFFPPVSKAACHLHHPALSIQILAQQAGACWTYRHSFSISSSWWLKQTDITDPSLEDWMKLTFYFLFNMDLHTDLWENTPESCRLWFWSWTGRVVLEAQFQKAVVRIDLQSSRLMTGSYCLCHGGVSWVRGEFHQLLKAVCMPVRLGANSRWSPCQFSLCKVDDWPLIVIWCCRWSCSNCFFKTPSLCLPFSMCPHFSLKDLNPCFAFVCDSHSGMMLCGILRSSTEVAWSGAC